MVPGLKYCKHIPIKNPTLAIIVFANNAPKPTIISYTPIRKNVRYTLCTDLSSAHASQRILHKIFRALARWNKFRLVIYKTIRKDIGSLIRMLRLCAFFAKGNSHVCQTKADFKAGGSYSLVWCEKNVQSCPETWERYKFDCGGT